MEPGMILKSIKNNLENWPLLMGTYSKWNQEWALPGLQAHRGYHTDDIAENSMAALAAARNNGYKMAEVDVQLTKDQIPIVFHDFNLKYIYKLNINVSEIDFADLSKLGTFPKLIDILEATDRPEFLNIEIKSKNLIKFPLEDIVVDMIKRGGFQDSILVSSFNPWALFRIKQVEKNITRALLVTDQPEIWNLYYLKRMWTLPLVEPHVLNIRHSMFNSELMANLKKFDVLTAAWTVNDLEKAKQLLGMGVSSIISDTLTLKNIT